MQTAKHNSLQIMTHLQLASNTVFLKLNLTSHILNVPEMDN